ncbi:multimerin-2-like [Mercenaria mercenaria]|uniref:multimerin-2-like n=1 Tax=Mercenaria mercenaria TaxID=6596 RepID=UPI00234F97C1|nr:multimerin-2-like [Mercenaria mercenaria]
MAACEIALLLAEICFVALVASQPQETDLMQLIKHIQAEGIEFKRKLGILEDTIHLQKEHIQKQDRRISFLENIIESQTDKIWLQRPTGKHHSDVYNNNVSKERWIDETEKDIHKKQKTPNPPFSKINEQRHLTDENAEFGQRGPTSSDVAKESITENRITRKSHLPSRTARSTPSPIAFQAYLSHDVSHVVKHQIIVFDSVITTIGGGYHGHHGLFTAPKTGIYIFSASILLQPNYLIEAEIMKNGQAVKGIFVNAHNHDNFVQSSGSAVLQLSVGDEVWIETTEWTAETALRGEGGYTSFMGCLIMEL